MIDCRLLSPLWREAGREVTNLLEDPKALSFLSAGVGIDEQFKDGAT